MDLYITMAPISVKVDNTFFIGDICIYVYKTMKVM